MAWIGNRAAAVAAARALPQDASAAFLRRVFGLMSVGLAVTGIMAMLVVASPALATVVLGNRAVFLGLIVAELLLVLAFAPIVERVSAPTAALMFVAYAALSGVTFSAIFLVYTAASIGSTFLVTAGTFGAMAAYGAVTRRNLDGIGSFCFMGLIGLIIASLVNLFLRSGMLYWLTTFAGVIVFTGLAAYDTAKLKALAASAHDAESRSKLAVHGALALYLDFVNLFLMLLRIFGRRR